jgi:hypothetical protein
MMKTKLSATLILAVALLLAILYLHREKPISRSGSVSIPPHATATISMAQPGKVLSADTQRATNYVRLLHDWLGTRHFDDTNASAAKSIVASRLLSNPDAVAFFKSNALALARHRIKTAQSPPLWGLENRELPTNAEIVVTAGVSTGFRAEIVFPDLPNGQGRIFVQVEGGTDPHITRLENSDSTEGNVIQDIKDPLAVAGWSWTNAVGSWDVGQAESWARSALSDYGPQINAADLLVKIIPSTYPAPSGSDPFPAISKQSARYPFAKFQIYPQGDLALGICEGTLAQTGPNQFSLVEFDGYFNHVTTTNPLGDLADKFLSTPDSDAWAQDIVTQAQSDTQHWLIKALELIAVRPPPGQ